MIAIIEVLCMDGVESRGGQLRVVHPWTVLDEDLVALQFQ